MNNLFKTLRILYLNDIDYILGGRFGLAIQGVDVVLDDEIDLCVDDLNFEKINKLFQNECIFNPELVDLPTFKAKVAKYKINDLTLEVMCNPQKLFSDGTWIGIPEGNVAGYGLNNILFKVFTLESEYIYYMQTSKEKPYRLEVAEKIKEQIDRTAKTKYILHGGKFQKDNEDNLRLRNHIVNTFKVKKILLCCFACESELWGTIFDSEVEKFKKISEDVSINLANQETFENQLNASDCMIIVGGDSFKLIDQLNEYDLTFLFKNKLILGISAGACAVSQSFYSNDESKCAIGLDLVNKKVFCHYNESKTDKLKLLQDFGGNLEIFSIPEFEYIFYTE